MGHKEQIEFKAGSLYKVIDRIFHARNEVIFNIVNSNRNIHCTTNAFIYLHSEQYESIFYVISDKVNVTIDTSWARESMVEIKQYD